MKIKTRAEEYTYEELEKIPETKMARALYNAINKRKILTYLEEKGAGKTLSIMQLVRKIVTSTNELPVVCIFRKNEKFEILDPHHFANECAWGEERLKLFKLRPEKLLDKANLVIFDDFHYMCEYVIDGKIPIEYLLDAMNAVIHAVEGELKPKCILISENQLAYYAEIFEDYRFDELLPAFGEIRYSQYSQKMTWGKWLEIRQIKYEREPLYHVKDRDIVDTISKLAECYIEPLAKEWLEKTVNYNPRCVINFFNYFNEKKITNITVDVIKEEAIKLLRDTEMAIYLEECPLFIRCFAPYTIIRMAEKFKDLKSVEVYIKNILKMRDDASSDVKMMKTILKNNAENIDKEERKLLKAWDNANTKEDKNKLLKALDKINEIRRLSVKLDDTEKLLLYGNKKEICKAVGRVSKLYRMFKRLMNIELQLKTARIVWKGNYIEGFGLFTELYEMDEWVAKDVYMEIKRGMYKPVTDGLMLSKPLLDALSNILFSDVYDWKTISEEEFKKELENGIRLPNIP